MINSNNSFNNYDINNNSNHDINNNNNQNTLLISPLFKTIEHEVSTKLLSKMLQEGHVVLSEPSVSIIVKLLKFYNHSKVQTLENISDLPQLLRILTQNIDDFVNFLQEVPETKKTFVFASPVGEIQPFGFYRSRVIELIEALVKTNYSCILDSLFKENVIQTCINYFFQYKWNNFLHSMVVSMLQVIFESCPESVLCVLIEDSKLIDLICQTMNDKLMLQKSGNSGHIVKITALILKSSNNFPNLNQILTQKSDWNFYIQNVYSSLIPYWQSNQMNQINK